MGAQLAQGFIPFFKKFLTRDKVSYIPCSDRRSHNKWPRGPTRPPTGLVRLVAKDDLSLIFLIQNLYIRAWLLIKNEFIYVERQSEMIHPWKDKRKKGIRQRKRERGLKNLNAKCFFFFSFFKIWSRGKMTHKKEGESKSRRNERFNEKICQIIQRETQREASDMDLVEAWPCRSYRSRRNLKL